MKFASKCAWLYGIAIFVATPVMAQQLPEMTLKVTQSELDVISEGLQTQPFGKVFPLINKLRTQIVEQQKPPQSTAPLVPSPTDTAKPAE